METQYLKTLCTVQEAGSFSKAASDLCITQSAVSQRIKLLEERYGLPLLDRTGTLVSLTDAGKVVMGKARQILALEKELQEELKNLGKKTRLSLCCTPTFGIVYLPKVLNCFFMAHSEEADLKFALNTPEQSLSGLIAKEYDMAIIEHCSELDVQGAVTYSLPPDELVLVSAPSLQLSGTELRLEELLLQRLIARRDGCSSRCLLVENLMRCGKHLEDFSGMIVYDDLYLTIQTVLAGSGIAFVSRNLVKEYIQRGELLQHTVKDFHCLRSRTAILSRSRSEEPFIKDFVKCVLAVFA